MSIKKAIANFFFSDLIKDEIDKKVGGESNLTRIQRAIVENQVELLSSQSIYFKIWVANYCTHLVSQNTSTLPFELVNVNNREKVDSKVLQVLSNPNELQTGIDLIYEMCSYYILDGNVYVYVPSSTHNKENSKRMWVLNSFEVEAIENKNSDEHPIKHFINRHTQQIYPTEEVIFIKTWNPRNRLKGLSRLQAGLRQIRYSEQLQVFKDSLYRNQARPSGIISPDMQMTDQNYGPLADYVEKNYGGPENAGKILFASQSIKFQPLSLSPEDLQLIQSENLTWAAIAQMIGVPAEMLNNLSTQKNYANYREARKALYEDTVINIGQTFMKTFSNFFFADKAIEFKINRSEIDALKPTAEELSKAYWFEPDRKRVLMGQPPTGREDMSAIWIPNNLIRIEDAMFQGDEGNV
jgi:HK97 family phage portal protein